MVGEPAREHTKLELCFKLFNDRVKPGKEVLAFPFCGLLLCQDLRHFIKYSDGDINLLTHLAQFPWRCILFSHKMSLFQVLLPCLDEFLELVLVLIDACRQLNSKCLKGTVVFGDNSVFIPILKGIETLQMALDSL